MDCLSGCCGSSATPHTESPYGLLLTAASLIPISHYLIFVLSIFLVFLYNFLEVHLIRDLVTGFRGQPVTLTFSPSSDLYHQVASKCKVLNGRFLSTPWLSSPHLQTAFLSFFGRPPVFKYRREIFETSDGGTIALDWLFRFDAKNPKIQVNDAISKDDETPIMIVIPGLTSDSASAYVKHLAFQMAKRGWNVVVSNHRGLGGVSITSDCLYNAGWTEDIRTIIGHLHCKYPQAPLFAVGTSIGANVLVKYLGEDGCNLPLVGAAAICSPWDLLICDRFINRRLVQKFYDKALTLGLKGYAQMHQTVISRLADWEGIKKSNSVRDFDNCATRIVGKYEVIIFSLLVIECRDHITSLCSSPQTVDTYYRRCSSSSYVGNVMVPLLCISALDDPVCTGEAIPWDECRANENIILATTQHGGHLAYFEGIAAKNLWWVRAVDEFLCLLHSSPLTHRKKMEVPSSISPLESSIDQAPYVNIADNGMVTAMSSEPITHPGDLHDEGAVQNGNSEDKASETAASNLIMQEITIPSAELSCPKEQDISSLVVPVRKCMDQLSKHNRKSMWLLAYIAIMTTWPVFGSALLFFFKKKFRNAFSSVSIRK